ncbi:hypothetical protein B0T19DRAFT_212537 [Cercophora scortea]|uniref:Kelch repeat-containing protein n=1 Tax=Cercophora scortea TaxID=314031 RepID=A0AAE0IG73_9PEZI|nr:hypothetical protein B0T19DRAFT_212537 [Cercophora scortea]
MPSPKLSHHSANSELSFHPPVRPKFHHQYTIDRIREGSGRPPSFSMTGKISKDRKSVFKELGLDNETNTPSEHSLSEREFGEITGLSSPTSNRTSELRVRRENRSGNDDSGRIESGRLRGHGETQTHAEVDGGPPLSPTASTSSTKPWYTKLAPGRRPRVRTVSSAPPSTMASFTRLSAIALLIAVVVPGSTYYSGKSQVLFNGADAGVIPNRPQGPGPFLEPRADSPTQVCRRWAHQAAQLNGTLYIYGGNAKTSSDQTASTWNNDFLTLDLTKSWDTSSPSLRGLPQPSGPPAVAMGYLWNDYNNLYLYGGYFSDNPYVEPAPVSTWKYAIGSQTWTEYKAPKTSAGNNSDADGVPVQRSAEGAGLSVPELGTSWYFGGHLDLSTTPGWSNQIYRVYLKSLLEFTHPGFTNNGVYSLADGTGAGDGGVYRNITEGGLQTNSGFTERADGALVFVPGWGEKGVLIGLAGGTNDTFADDLSTLDVYDIASSVWYHQQTSGDPPSYRVNPCAVIASAPDASSFQIYLYGGQNLLPYGEQVQYSDMYILSIPSFTWIKAAQSGNNKPAARAGHTCNLRDGQIVVVGGYLGSAIPCDSPGIYVFNASSLEWTSRFNALDHPADLHPENSVLGNSYGYQVPDVVASVIGGGSTGGATATTPAAGPATGGPFATGKSPVFTITASGNTATVTQWGPGATNTGSPSTPGGGGSSNPSSPSAATDDRRPGLIAAGVIAGFAGLLALYLGYCAWLYRRQVRAYKSHLAVANRYSPAGASGLVAAFFGRKTSKQSKRGDEKTMLQRGRREHRRDASTASSAADGSVDGAPVEPKMLFDDEPTPESGYSSSGRGHGRTSYAASSTRPARPGAWWDGEGSGVGSASGTGTTPGTGSGQAGGRRSGSRESGSSTEALLEGQEPSFFSVVLGPRRALRVVNGLEGDQERE